MTSQSKLWIQNPVSDLIFYSFGWLVIFFLLLVFSNNYGVIILIVLLFSYVHRHYTFALVYGEREEFEKHRNIYIGLPIVCLIATVAFVYLDSFKILLTISVLWTIYHTIAQKYGITRIYSRKAGYGEPRTELWTIYSWVIFLFFYMIATQYDRLLDYRAARFLVSYLVEYKDILKMIATAALVASVYFTIRYIYVEYKNRDKISIPKNLYMLSILLIYATFLHSVVVGYVVMGFSHAIEYIAFVNFFVDRKYKKKTDSKSVLAKASKKLWLYSGIFALAVVALALTGRHFDKQALAIYIVGTSFLHFTYDGLIWKVRRPDVGKPLEINYKST